jgi:hypothetical protein
MVSRHVGRDVTGVFEDITALGKDMFCLGEVIVIES